jgi:hypothetical protein
MDLSTILSDKPLPARTDSTERTDDKSRIEVDEPVGSGPDDEETATTSVAPEAKAEAKVETPAETPAEEKARNEKGQFQKTVPQEALHAERQKRQELERKLAEQSQKPPPSVLEDEDGAFNARIALATAPLQEKLFKLSVKAARNVPGREDYSEITSAFMEAADRDPQLIKAFREADDPGEYAYTVGKQIRELADEEKGRRRSGSCGPENAIGGPKGRDCDPESREGKASKSPAVAQLRAIGGRQGQRVRGSPANQRHSLQLSA